METIQFGRILARGVQACATEVGIHAPSREARERAMGGRAANRSGRQPQEANRPRHLPRRTQSSVQ